MTKGTIVEVNVSELGMVTTGGKVVWASEYRVVCLAVYCRTGVADAWNERVL
jgi:hypothetical protein